MTKKQLNKILKLSLELDNLTIIAGILSVDYNRSTGKPLIHLYKPKVKITSKGCTKRKVKDSIFCEQEHDKYTFLWIE